MLLVWLKKTGFNTKITEIEGKISDVSSLVTKFALTVVENKIPDVSSLVKTTHFNTKVTETEGKIPDVSSLVKKTDFDTKFKNISHRVTKNKTKHFLVENELKKLQKFDAVYFRGKSHFEDGTQNYLVFQTIYKYFKRIAELVLVIIYTFGNLKVCLMKNLILLLHLTIKLHQN